MNLNHMILFVLPLYTMKSCSGHPRCQRMLLWNFLEDVVHHNTIIHDEKLHDVLVTPQTRVLTKNASRAVPVQLDARLFFADGTQSGTLVEGQFRTVKLLS